MTTWTALILACGDPSSEAGGGPAPDARLMTDLHLWVCSRDSEDWMGVAVQEVTVTNTPDQALGLPDLAPGACTGETDAFFPIDAGPGAEELPDLVDLWWETDNDQGVLSGQGPGYWTGETDAGVVDCARITDALAGNLRLSEAGILTGAETPPPGASNPSLLPAKWRGVSGTPLGATGTVEWDASGWERAYFLHERLRSGEVWEAVACAPESTGAYEVTAAHWDEQVTEALSVDEERMSIVLVNIGESELDGVRVLTETRATISTAF